MKNEDWQHSAGSLYQEKDKSNKKVQGLSRAIQLALEEACRQLAREMGN
jgi:hypothetical protein